MTKSVVRVRPIPWHVDLEPPTKTPDHLGDIDVNRRRCVFRELKWKATECPARERGYSIGVRTFVGKLRFFEGTAGLENNRIATIHCARNRREEGMIDDGVEGVVRDRDREWIIVGTASL